MITYEIKPFSCYDNWSIAANGENISSIIDKLLRITTKVTEQFAGDIIYDIQPLERAVKEHTNFDRVLVFREDAVHGHNTENKTICCPSYISGIQVWRVTHDPETESTVLTRVYLRADNHIVGM